MHCTKQITQDIYWVGGNDRRIALFESAFPVPRGISYNAYLALDEKTVLLDTVDSAVSGRLFENLEHLLDGRALDYIIINHMEPDHCASLAEAVLRWPQVRLVGNAKTKAMLQQFFTFDVASRFEEVKEGDTLCTGRHTFTFAMAPMVHWPEVMVSYDSADKVLFSADAFGTFGALTGNIFADELKFEAEWLPDARRYYANIVGKYGTQVLALLKKAAALDIEMIAPLHGPVWRQDLAWFIGKYQQWGSYTPEENAVAVFYASVYGDTQNAAELLAARLADDGVRNIVMYDVSVTPVSELVAECFRCSHLVFASTTYNAGIFVNMETLLLDLKAHNLQNRTVALVENGSWAPTSGALMRNLLEQMKNITVLDSTVTLKSSVKEEQAQQLCALADELAALMLPEKTNGADAPAAVPAVDPNALFKLSYGLFVLTAKDGAKDNGCIINTVMQVAEKPNRIIVSVNKKNLTHDMILKTGVFNVSVLTEAAPFKVFQHFGFQSGRDVEKFAACTQEMRAANGVLYLPKYTNAVLSGHVISAEDRGSHTVFTAEVVQAQVLSDEPSITYTYYFAHTKPKPQPTTEKKKGFVCKICGYIYEGDTLPADFICPLCKHGAEDFEPLK